MGEINIKGLQPGNSEGWSGLGTKQSLPASAQTSLMYSFLNSGKSYHQRAAAWPQHEVVQAEDSGEEAANGHGGRTQPLGTLSD